MERTRATISSARPDRGGTPPTTSTATDDRRKSVDWLAKSLSGAGAGVVATVLCSPLDVAKSRMQVQSALGGSKGQQYTGVSSALLKIFRDEGVGGWYQASRHTQVAHKSHTHKSHTHKSHTHKSHTRTSN